MNRRDALAFLALAALAPHPVRAQSRRLPRIGYLTLISITDPPSRERQAFLDGLREYGHVPGKTIEIIYRSAENVLEFLDETCADLLKQQVDIIVVNNAAAVLAAKKATTTVPIVLLAVGDPIGIGAVKSLGRPGGNVTGASFISSDLAAKQVQLLKEVLPGARRIAMLWHTPNRQAAIESETAMAAAEHLGMKPERFPVGSAQEMAQALARLQATRPDALYVAFEGVLMGTHGAALAEFGLRNRIPLMSGWSGITDFGGLMSYAPNMSSIFRRSAYYVHRILNGAKPADLPVEQSSTVGMVVNLKTAAALGITIPHATLLRADRVIE